MLGQNLLVLTTFASDDTDGIMYWLYIQLFIAPIILLALDPAIYRSNCFDPGDTRIP